MIRIYLSGATVKPTRAGVIHVAGIWRLLAGGDWAVSASRLDRVWSHGSGRDPEGK